MGILFIVQVVEETAESTAEATRLEFWPVVLLQSSHHELFDEPSWILHELFHVCQQVQAAVAVVSLQGDVLDGSTEDSAAKDLNSQFLFCLRHEVSA